MKTNSIDEKNSREIFIYKVYLLFVVWEINSFLNLYET